MTPSILALLLLWPAVLDGCDGRPLSYPEQVTYAVPYILRAMVHDPACALDQDGNPQPCATALWTDEWATSDPWLLVDATPDPPVGAVYDIQFPVAVNPAGRSDGCP